MIHDDICFHCSVLSSDPSCAATDRRIRRGAEDHIMKPLEQTTLMTAIRRAGERSVEKRNEDMVREQGKGNSENMVESGGWSVQFQ